jgi:predicted RNA binding protein YcfA (HicA-like mRNA interferase family)
LLGDVPPDPSFFFFCLTYDIIYNIIKIRVLGGVLLGKLEKLLHKIFKHPIPNDIQYSEVAKLLISVGCTIQKRTGSSHRNFKHPNFPKIITLMGTELVRPYQIKLVRELLGNLGIVQEE